MLFNNGMTTLSCVIVKVLLHCRATVEVAVLELELPPLLHLMPQRPVGWQSQCGAGKNMVFPRSQGIWPSLYKASEGPEPSVTVHKVWLQVFKARSKASLPQGLGPRSSKRGFLAFSLLGGWSLGSCDPAFELSHLYATVGERIADTFIKVT